MKHVVCNLCGADDAHRVCSIHSFAIVRCRRCGLLYVNPQPTSKELVQHYMSEYYHEEEAREGCYGQGSGHLFADVLRLCRTYVPVGRVLDVGCGYGFFLKAMREAGYSTCGVELSVSACQYATHELSLSVVDGTLEEAGFPENYFHIVALNNVLEHLNDPLSTLQLVWRLLAPEGLLVTIVPNLNFGKPLLWACGSGGMRTHTLQPLAHAAMTHLALFDVPNHLYFYSPATLVHMLRKAGFQNIVVRNAVPIRNPGRRLRTLNKLILYQLARAAAAATGGQLLLGPSLMAYALKYQTA